MSHLLRKLVVVAAVDGFLLQPPGLRQHGNSEASTVRIDYGTGKISCLPAASAAKGTDSDEGLEAYGLVGLLSVSSYSFLIAITQRKQVAQIHGKPIYTATNVAVIPTTSQPEASLAIAQAREGLLQEESKSNTDYSAPEDPDSTLSDTETETGTETGTDGSGDEYAGDDTTADIGSLAESPVQETRPSRDGGHARSNSIAEDVIGKKVRFGRYAANWLSRRTLGLPGLGTAGQSTSNKNNAEAETEAAVETEAQKQTQTQDGVSSSAGHESPSTGAGKGDESESNPTVEMELLPKLLRYTKMVFSSQNFFFAYDYDITRHFGSQGVDPTGFLPLHKMVDELFFWNRHLLAPFIAADAHSYVLPLMQGFVGQREFTVAAGQSEGSDKCPESRILGEKSETTAAEENNTRDFLLTLISRRSIKRPGVRYLRRGVDDDGNTANTVETEQILSVPDWNPLHRAYSYLQVRGSIPLYFSQSPYAFKPVPVLHHSTETNQLAFERHFRQLSHRYGKVQAVSLIDKQAGELKLGNEYTKYAQTLNEAGGVDGTALGMEWFDFHNECRGMKFENVSRLVDRIRSTLEEYEDTIVQGNTTLRRQTGIVRTNCMDCLDRTGVAQCAFGQWALEHELKQEGIEVNLSGDSPTTWFNTLWADNGDAISKQYSSTAALKGDYTRTRKRDIRGALNDFGLTMSRYFNNLINDFFSQACIDYMLGNVSTQVFEEFSNEMQTADPGISVQKLRQNAIDTSCRIVISDASEEVLGGWTMLTPHEPNTLRTLPFEESVLLLTDAAVYSCRFDWDTDKVVSFERIALRSVTRIRYGTYITSILTDAQTDKHHNVGLVIEYESRESDSHALRVNTRSLQSSVDPRSSPSSEWDLASWFQGWNKNSNNTKKNDTRLMAFKALPLSNSVTQTKAEGKVSERDWVRSICEQIERAVRGDHDQGGSGSVVDEAEIISEDEARKRTGYWEYLVYDIKKLVWA